ncbi:MAG: hypothetical protein JNM20_10930 [Rhizobiales bacterium]|nr:hypothetical protein [Hyphomicrobiales bacterium]
MRSFLALVVALGFLFCHAPPFAADREPVAHIVEVELAGEDVVKGTAVVREGAEHKPQIWMPLYDGDIVFVRDAKSHILVDYGAGGRVEVGGKSMRVTVSAETAHGGETWSLITAIGSLLAGEEDEEVPANLISKGEESVLQVRAANRTPNSLVRDDQPVWVAWSGGAAPFAVALDTGGKETSLAPSGEREARFEIPKDAGQRMTLIITDAGKRSVRVPFRLREALPAVPDGISGVNSPEGLAPVLVAAWLAGQDDGAWRLEAVRMLRNADAGKPEFKRLSDALLAGWRP